MTPETALVFGTDLDNEPDEDTRTEAEREADAAAGMAEWWATFDDVDPTEWSWCVTDDAPRVYVPGDVDDRPF